MAFTVGCQTKPTADKVLGALEIHDEQIKNPWPTVQPNIIYVSDFSLDAAHFENEQGIGGLLPRQRLKRLGHNLPHALASSEPDSRLKKLWLK
jgi:hypothetical protein